MNLSQIREFLTPQFLTWDMMVIIGVLMFFLVFSMYLGQRKIILFILSAYVASAIFHVVPENGLSSIMIANTVSLDVVLFSALLGFIFFFFSFSTLYEIIGKSTKRKLPSKFKVATYGIIAGAFILSIIFSFLDESIIGSFSEFSQQIFLTDYAQLGWSLIPVITMIVLK